MNIHQKQKVEELKIEFIKKVESLITSGSARESFLNVYQDKNDHVYVMLNTHMILMTIIDYDGQLSGITYHKMAILSR